MNNSTDMDPLIPKKKFPQPLIELLKDVGENLVLINLYKRVQYSSWMALKNIQEVGCDIVLLNPTNNQTIKIEVKTRQELTNSKTKKTNPSKHFSFSKVQYDAMDFLVCYWFDFNTFFIIPKKQIPDDANQIIIRRSNNNKEDPEATYGVYEMNKNNWGLIIGLAKEKDSP